ncbi:hypothetical protein, partial [uncultured Desulfovibrio sp.]|uniref:hypothetical protein n=1 Tax=uncultured Desulfovibrio sp. TaxID=167968 RepID=UPI002636D5F7
MHVKGGGEGDFFAKSPLLPRTPSSFKKPYSDIYEEARARCRPLTAAGNIGEHSARHDGLQQKNTG